MFGQKAKMSESNHRSATPTVVKHEPAPRSASEEQNAVKCHDSENVIGKGTVIHGNIVAEGDLLIEGTVRGDVDTKATLILGPTCVIEGNIVAENAEVAGQVKGTVKATGLLVIKSSSMIDGDVLTKNLNVESGSTFNGKFTVGSFTNTQLPKKNEPTVKADISNAAPNGRATVPGVSPVPSKV